MNNYTFPKQQISSKSKTEAWKKKCVDWADNKTYLGSTLVRHTVQHKQINYDLLNGKIHMKDLYDLVNPEHQKASFIPESIPHYPIMNSKLNVLRGEEYKRPFDYRVVVTNPTSISEIEETKKEQLFEAVKQLIMNTSQSEEEFNQELTKLQDYFNYEWQDIRETRANAVLRHYSKEQNFNLIFNKGFVDGYTVGEEIYQCDIINNEPVLEKLNPLKVRIFKSGFSNRIEDADIIILEDYWSVGKIIDTYYEALTPKDMKYLETLPNTIGSGAVDSMDNYDERVPLMQAHMMNEEFELNVSDIFDNASNNLLPYDMEGNVRVLRVYWKSRRKIKKVKSYDPMTGEVIYNFYTEDYIINEKMGEEEETLWINEAWEGTKIGTDVYVNMRPRPIQYNTLTNPSKCHFGIIGSIYNLNDDRPFSLVDMMKKYNYYYDVIHDRLNKMIARNWGKIMVLDLAKVPANWQIDKWLHYAKTNGLAVVDSFKEGNVGAATGKLAGALNNASSGVIDAELGNSIQSQLNLLEYIKNEMSEVVGISKQREGQISNRETVGGVERATLQSSHITEWVFTIHNDVKKRVCECFLETAKIAFKGKNIKFQYILPNLALKMMDIEGDEFAESDYGLVVESDVNSAKLESQLETLAQAALQNSTLDFSAIMKIYGTSSLAEKQRIIEANEKQVQERQAQQQQQMMQQQQQQMEIQQQLKMNELQQQDLLNQRDNETKILIATINAQNTPADLSSEKLSEQIREFDEKLKLEKERLAFDKDKSEKELKIKSQKSITK